MNQPELRWTAAEEASLPQHPTKDQLNFWRHSKSGIVCFHEVFVKLPHTLRTNLSSFLKAEEHRHGLSPAIKRLRKHPKKLEDIRLRANHNLPLYLQDVERYNPELMRRAKTEVHSTLPTIDVIEEERKFEETSLEKAWKHGVLLEDYLGFNSAIRHTDTDDNKIKSAKSNQLNSDASEASVNDDYEADNEDDGSDET